MLSGRGSAAGSEANAPENHSGALHLRAKLCQERGKGRKAAGRSLLGSATALALALLLQSPQVMVFGTIGSMAGLGAYGIRIFQKFRTPQYEELADELRDLDTTRLISNLPDEEYARLRAIACEDGVAKERQSIRSSSPSSRRAFFISSIFCGDNPPSGLHSTFTVRVRSLVTPNFVRNLV